MPLCNGLLLFALNIFLYLRRAFLPVSASVVVIFSSFFITCQTFFIFSALLAFIYKRQTGSHTNKHTQCYLSASGWKNFLSALRSPSRSILSPFSFPQWAKSWPPSCLGKWSKNKWMIEWKPRQLARGKTLYIQFVCMNKKWPARVQVIRVFKANGGRQFPALQFPPPCCLPPFQILLVRHLVLVLFWQTDATSCIHWP